jgi:hypothetical protein
VKVVSTTGFAAAAGGLLLERGTGLEQPTSRA